MNLNQKNNKKNKAKSSEHELSNISLQRLGYNEWFHAKSKGILQDDFSAARVIEVNKDNFKVSNGVDEINAELSGKYLFDVESSIDYPTVGDWVAVQYFNDNSLAIIHQLLPRKSLLKRKNPGKKVDFQLIAANIDYALIMQSVDSNFNLNRMERYLVMANDSKIHPIIVFTKTDLIFDNELNKIIEKTRRLGNKYMIFATSNITVDGLKSLHKELKPNKTYCLLGSSGVGKTTLLNKLLGREVFEVKEVRDKDNKGRHTTTRRQLICLESGSIFIDTPGMRELGNFTITTGIEETFEEIKFYSKQCRFKNCTHVKEPGCAVKDAVEKEIIDKNSYKNFLKIQKEARYYNMSYIEKRRKDKAFGKMIKNYKKSKKK